jgi:hypothetical protein
VDLQAKSNLTKNNSIKCGGAVVAASGASSISLNLRRQRLLPAFKNRKLPPLSFPEEFKKA